MLGFSGGKNVLFDKTLVTFQTSASFTPGKVGDLNPAFNNLILLLKENTESKECNSAQLTKTKKITQTDPSGHFCVLG